MKKYLLFASVAFFFFASCTNNEALLDETNPSATPIIFTGSVTTNTKVSGTSWNTGDEISVVMKKTGKTLIASSVILPNPAEVVSVYKTVAGDGIFMPTKTASGLSFPQNGEVVDLIAFYPKSHGYGDYTPFPMSLSTVYGMSAADGIYILYVDLLDQSNQENLDLLYSNNLVKCSITNPNTQLNFTRKMSKVEYNIIAGEGLTDADLVGLKAYLHGPSTAGIFNLSHGKFDSMSKSSSSMSGRPRDLMITMKSSENGKFSEGTIFPERILGNQTRIEFVLKNGQKYTLAMPDNVEYEVGKKYIYTITLKRSEQTTKTSVELNKATISDWSVVKLPPVTIN